MICDKYRGKNTGPQSVNKKSMKQYIPTLLAGRAKSLQSRQGSRINLFTVYFWMPSETFTIRHLVVGLLIELERIWKEVIMGYCVTS
jgi:hypothetical protein